ncbi:MAG: hypothetical protein JXA57_16735 [Armatimonadetes bacterium]|nr:hypothetical protein [Armatimonadota bacterium]
MRITVPRRLMRRRWQTLALSRLAPILAPRRTAPRVVDDSGSIDVAPTLMIDWPDDKPRPRVGLVRDIDAHPYWTKYQRFLRDNRFPFRVIDIHSNSWIDELADLDMVVWCPASELYELEEARKKIFYMGEFLGLSTYPSLRAVNLYEDKVAQAWALAAAGADTPKTVVSFNKDDALREVAALGSEVVWKIAAGASSAGVERLTARRARVAIRKAFSTRGRMTYWPYANQKGYVYAQALERDLNIDMRVVVTGPVLSGMYRDTPRGDFRASGMGLIRKGGIPPGALEEAWRISRTLDVGAVAVDFITDDAYSRRKVIEFSSFIKVRRADYLVVDGEAGCYVREGPGCFEFRPGRLWLQELALAQALGRVCGLDSDRLLHDSLRANGPARDS